MNIFQFFRGSADRIKQIKQQQSSSDAQVGMLKKEFAEHPSSGLTPAKLGEILREAELGNLMAQADLAEDMEEKDAHIFAEVAKRKNALLNVDWHIEPPRNASAAEKQDAQLLEEIILDMGCIDNIILDLADGILKGFSCIEKDWVQRDGLWVPNHLEQRPQRWFMVSPDNQNELRLRNQTAEGAELRQFNWICHKHKAKSGYLGRANLARVLAWPFLFKNYSVRDLAEFLEIYGLPIRIGKYTNGADDTEKNSLLRALMQVGHNAGGIIPRGMEIEFHNAANGQADPFELMISWCERSQSKAILGGTLTSQADGKSSTNALGNVHNDVREELRNSDLRQIAQTLTRDLVMELYVLNGKSFTDSRRLPKFEFDIQEPEDLKLFSESLPSLVDVGLQIPVNWAQEKLQIPLPEKDEQILKRASAPQPIATEADKTKPPMPEPAATPAATKAKVTSAITALKAMTTIDPQEQQVAALNTAAAPKVQQLLDDIANVVNDASTMEDLRDSLNELDLDPTELGEILQNALTAGQLSGMYDVSEGN